MFTNFFSLPQSFDNSINHEEIASRLLRSLKKKSDSVIESSEGYQMTDPPKYLLSGLGNSLKPIFPLLFCFSFLFLPPNPGENIFMNFLKTIDIYLKLCGHIW